MGTRKTGGVPAREGGREISYGTRGIRDKVRAVDGVRRYGRQDETIT